MIYVRRLDLNYDMLQFGSCHFMIGVIYVFIDKQFLATKYLFQGALSTHPF